MKRLIPTVFLVLTSCTGAKPTGLETTLRRVPDAPPEYVSKARPLPINKDKTMGGQVRDNNNNIRAYNDLAHIHNRLIDLYNCVKISINTGKEPTCQ